MQKFVARLFRIFRHIGHLLSHSIICSVSLKFALENVKTFSHLKLAIILTTSFQGKIKMSILYAIVEACNR